MYDYLSLHDDDSTRKGEVERVTQRLAGRVQELETRYADPLPELENEVDALSDTVDEHLKAMGVTWS